MSYSTKDNYVDTDRNCNDQDEYKPFGDLSKVDPSKFHENTLLHELYLEPNEMTKGLELLVDIERKRSERSQEGNEMHPKVTIKRADMERFCEETGLRPWMAEEFFIMAKGDVEEALLIWMNRVPGEPLKPLSEYENPILCPKECPKK